MKKNTWHLLWLHGLLALPLLVSCHSDSATQAATGPNLIPNTPGTTPSYWCTWGAQNYAPDTAVLGSAAWGVSGHSGPANQLTEAHVFGPGGWAGLFPARIRPDLYVVLDVGWDIPLGTNLDQERWRLGSLVPATDKFPSCQGTPAERLTCLNRLAKAAGWKGVGLWVAAQPGGLGKAVKLSRPQQEAFYRERARWCRQAGINYWKVDYGDYGSDLAFRAMLTRVAKEEAPGLLVENARNGAPFNDEECPWDTKNYTRTGRFRPWDNGAVLATVLQTLAFSQVLRTYDVTFQLPTPTTLDRVAQIYRDSPARAPRGGILNSEDEVTLAAVLGNASGIMRHPLFHQVHTSHDNPHQSDKKMDELVRAFRWQRLAPAFPVGTGAVALDSAYLSDNWTFRPGDSWVYWLPNKTVTQRAPARVSRGIALPQVTADGERPYVVAGRNPSGAVAVATLPRVKDRREYYPPADVSLDVGDAPGPVGIFGEYASLRLRFAALPAHFRLLAQDLAGDHSLDITDRVKVEGQTVLLPGALLHEVGLAAATPGDHSPPGLLVKVTTP